MIQKNFKKKLPLTIGHFPHFFLVFFFHTVCIVVV
jgi:hypothetical protein